MKKRLCALTAAALGLAVLLSGCQSAVTAGTPASSAASQSAAEDMTLSVAWTGTGTNPYLADDLLTRQNATLLFEPLVAISPEMELEQRLALSIDNSGTTVTIQMRSGCYFANGAEITAEDAAASLRAACASTAYSGRFTNVQDITVQGTAVCVTLAAPDSLFAYLLDIPVIRADEISLAQPTASGRYTYGGDGVLVKNERAPFPEEGGPATIQLVQATTTDALVSGLAKGEIDLYATAEDADGTATINTTASYYRTNCLVFLGINAYADNPLCSTPAGRALLSALCDRNALCSQSYSGQGYAATGAINSLYPIVKGRQQILAVADTSTLDTVMAQLGYTKDEDTGLYQDARHQPAAVSLLVNGSNSYKRAAAYQLQQQWQDAGIQVNVTEAATYEDYLTAVHAGQFELYIGETKLYNNIELSPFWSGEASYGLAPSEPLLAAYDAFRLNAGTAADFEAAFAAEMPYIPLLWHSGTVVTSRRVSGITASLSSIFYSLGDMHISE